MKSARVAKVLRADAPQLADELTENIEATPIEAKDHLHILAPATVHGKNLAPR